VPDFRQGLDRGVKGLRIGMPEEYFVGGVQPAVAEAVRSAIDHLEGLGAEVVKVNLPHTEYSLPTYYLIATAEASANLARFDYLTHDVERDEVTLAESIRELLTFRSVDPLYGAFLVRQLARGSYEEKLQALESVLPIPPAMERLARLPDYLEAGPLQVHVLEPALISMGIVSVQPGGGVSEAPSAEEGEDYWAEPEAPRLMRLPEMLKALFDARLAAPEELLVRPQWLAGGILELEGDFYKYVKSRGMEKNEGIVLRHLLRLVILAGEFRTLSQGDPDYERIDEQVTRICQRVDARYTERFLTSEAEAVHLAGL